MQLSSIEALAPDEQMLAAKGDILGFILGSIAFKDGKN